MRTIILFYCCILFSYFSIAQNVGIGITNPIFKLDVRSGSINTDSLYRIGTITVLAVPGTSNLFVGKDAGRINSSGFNNTFSGDQAGYTNSSGNQNSFFGSGAGYSNTTADGNSFFGYAAGNADSSGQNNSFFGWISGALNTTGAFNSFFGNGAGFSNITGSENTALGYNTNVSTGALTNATAIGARAYATQSNSLILGSINGVNGATSNVNVGIGTSSPDRSFTIYNSAGSYMNTKDGTREFMMGADVNGGILSVISNHDLILRTGGNVEKMRITAAGNVGIGTSLPFHKLQVTTSTPSINAIHGLNNGSASGTDWNPGNNFAGVHGEAASGSTQYQAGVYGYQIGSGNNSGAVVGAYSASIWGGLGYTDGSGVHWGVYTPTGLYAGGDVNMNGALKINGSPGTSGQFLASNGASAPTWQNAAYSNNTRFAVTFSSTSSSGNPPFTSTQYNLNTSDIVINPSNITINKQGLYHFEGHFTYGVTSTSASLTASLTLSVNAHSYQIIDADNVPQINNGPNAYSLSRNFSMDLHVFGPGAILSLSYSSSGSSTAPTYSVTGHLSGYLINQ